MFKGGAMLSFLLTLFIACGDKEEDTSTEETQVEDTAPVQEEE